MLSLVCGGEWSVSAHGVIAGLFFFRCGEKSFPAEKWSDLPTALLEDWHDELQAAFRAEETRFALYFLDGEYALQAEKRWVDARLWLDIAFVSDWTAESPAVEASCRIPAWRLLSELERGAGICMDFCRASGIKDEKLSRVREGLAALADRFLF